MHRSIRNGKLFSTTSYQDALEKGVIVEGDKKHYSAGQRSPAGDKILEFLKNKPEGANSNEIKIELNKYQELSKSLANHSFIYNVFKALKKKSLIKKEGEIYYAIS